MSQTDLVRELRGETGAGVLACLQALEAAKGDFNKAREILRREGHERAAKRGGRVTGQGLIGMKLDPAGRRGVLVELLCETDFVARTAPFRDYLKLSVGAVDRTGLTHLEDLLLVREGDRTLREHLDSLIAQIGENIVIAAAARVEARSPYEKVGGYLHMGDQVGSLVLVKREGRDIPDNLIKDILLHITAMQPSYVSRDEVPSPKQVEIREEFSKEAGATGKPQAIVDKIAQGKLERWFSEVCLVEQPFVRDPSGKTTFAKFLEGAAPGARVERFVRFQVGGTSDV